KANRCRRSLWSIAAHRSVSCPIRSAVSLVSIGTPRKAAITLGGTLAGVATRGIVVEAVVGQLPAVRLAFAWAQSDQVPFLLGQFNFFEVFDVLFARAHRVFEIRVPGATPTP